MRVFRDIVYGSDDVAAQKLNLYLPESAEFDLLIYVHGGGLRSGTKEEVETSVPTLVDQNIAVVSVEYRKYPQYEYPSFLSDAVLAAKWARDHIGEYGKCKKMFLGGSSAGGYIAMMLCFDRKYLSECGLSPMDFDGFIFDAGQTTNHFTVLQNTYRVDPRRVIVDETSALYHVGVDDEYPPMLFIVSDHDMQNRYEQTMLMISTLKHFGHAEPKVQLKVMRDSTHCMYVKDKSRNPEYCEAICRFISEA